jgi:hypothetical protein
MEVRTDGLAADRGIRPNAGAVFAGCPALVMLPRLAAAGGLERRGRVF